MTVSSSAEIIEKLRPGRGHGGLHPPAFGGGGGGDRGPGDGPSDYERRLRRARLALLLGIVSICGIFITVTVVLMLRHSSVVLDPQTHLYVREWISIQLPTRLLLWNTVVLLLSTFTMEMARRAVAREMLLAPIHQIAGIAPDRGLKIPWVVITATLGLLFLFGQWLAWQALRANGFHISTVGMSPFFYLLTGAHAVHLSVGILALLYASVITLTRTSLEHRRIVVEIAAWYWHFMSALWLYILALLQFGY